ncbi:MAG: CAP domain-containing protein [Oscillospiraceae bacterium]|nr:CAP domain-containing protein [Oscillospiraceae bacterium]
MKRFITLLTAVLMTLVIWVLPASAASLKLDKSSVNVPIGYKTTLKVSGASEQVEWSVKDSKIASVTSTGKTAAKVVGKGTGSTYVYAKVNGKTLKCRVTVKKSFISLSGSKLSLEKDNSAAVTMKVTGSKAIQCSNSDNSVCSVSFGKWNDSRIKLNIKAKNAGTSVITVYAKGYSSSTAKKITVTVKDTTKDPAVLIEEVVSLVNDERSSDGKSALKSDSELNKLAAVRAEEVASSFSHTRPDGRSCFSIFDDYGVRYMAVGENIAMSKIDAETVMNMWMDSPGHRGNILSGSYSKIGVGVYISGKYAYWVQLFAA